MAWKGCRSERRFSRWVDWLPGFLEEGVGWLVNPPIAMIADANLVQCVYSAVWLAIFALVIGIVIGMNYRKKD